MRWRHIVLPMLLSAASAADAAEQASTDPSVGWIAKLMLGAASKRQLTLDLAEKHMLLVYKTMNNNQPRFNDVVAQLDQSYRAPRERAQRIASFLEKDIDNDGKVSTEELKTFLEPQSRSRLRSVTGIQVEPTLEQTEEIMQQLLAKNLEADTNGDGTIDFDEMRSAAATDSFTRISTLRLTNPMIIERLDTSGDRTISQDEFIAAVRKSFNVIDRDKNGKISLEDAQPYLPGITIF